MSNHRWNSRVGDWVEVRSAEEILATLDDQGELARMPFMPEMLKFAGRRFEITAVAHKTCDTVHRSGGRTVADAVHLADLRCDGKSHGGCEANCLLFWKKHWLKPVDGPGNSAGEAESAAADAPAPAVLARACATRRADGVEIYRCQATTLPVWTEPLQWWDVRQYWADVRNGNVKLGYAASILFLSGLNKLRRLPFGYRLTKWLYGKAHLWLRGFPDPHPTPGLAGKSPTPVVTLGLQPGELVEVRSLDEINATINETFRNRGLFCSPDDTRHCGRKARVSRRVTRIINEASGEMMTFGNSCIALEDINCLGEYSDKRLLCPRRINSYFREAWLKRVEENGGPPTGH